MRVPLETPAPDFSRLRTSLMLEGAPDGKADAKGTPMAAVRQTHDLRQATMTPGFRFSNDNDAGAT